ncbi:hypothetical protein [Ulvibacter antarcticus]|uniref:Uncharacterized protein n=1 Tax=Ulvibacter antarcticus TaxID=442714 RepID=A0A3L9Z2S0_9FLAO|nr:hypothetical protein [Ulvibacter antarcticus]RMA65719.1 hypothetical protein BXY75_0131 [Ulvibacter antarcticus]
MKVILSILFCAFFMVSPPDLTHIRKIYGLASGNTEIIAQLEKELATVSKDDNKVLVAYKGAVLTMAAKYAKKNSDKKEFFKEGAGLIEFAIASEPENIEIRTIRLSIQEHAPKFLKYHDNISEDKEFILRHYKNTTSTAVKNFVKLYVMSSESFSEEDKMIF